MLASFARDWCAQHLATYALPPSSRTAALGYTAGKLIPDLDLSRLHIRAYLDRIDFRRPAPPTLETLRALHYAHLLAVPFENLDIPERPIILGEERFFDKIVRRRRGGFCYELNGLFAALLRALGFRVTLLSGRVDNGKGAGSVMREFDHLALRVDLDGPWLADVGFGESFYEPLPLADHAQCAEAGMKYWRECGDDARWRVLSRRGQNGNGAKLLYDFTLQAHPLSDFAAMCRYHQTAPESPFMQRKVCTRLTPKGRVTLANMRLIITEDGARQERTLADPHEYAAALRQYFGIEFAEIPPQPRTDAEETKGKSAKSA